MSKKVIVIGGGPGGYTAAIRLAQLGAHVTLIEKDNQGGTCLNRGCIPTKALVKSAEVANTIANASAFGVNVTGFEIDFGKIVERKNDIVKKLCDGILALLKANKVDFLRGCGYFVDKNTVEVKLSGDNEIKTLTADNIIIATGSIPFIPPIEGSNLPGIHTSDTIMDIQKRPESLTIIGGGIIGMEFASIFQSLGTKVTVIEALPAILGKIDSDIVKRMLPMFKKRGVDIYTGTTVSSISKTEKVSQDANASETASSASQSNSTSTSTPVSTSEYTVNATGKTGPLEIKSEALLIATGRKSYTEGLGLEKLGLEMNRSAIMVDPFGRTTTKNIYAIGDVTGGWMLAHAAAHQGIVAAQHIMGAAHHINEASEHDTREAQDDIATEHQTSHSSDNIHPIGTIPSCVFTFPEIACAGLTESELKEQNIPYKSSRFMFGANGKALCLGEGEGFVKVLASDEGKVLGVHIMGPHASDLIHEAVLAMDKGITTAELSNMVHAHPTLSESLSEAFMGIEGIAIHMVNPKNVT